MSSVPVINLSPFAAGGSVQERQEVAGAIRQACIDIGFFYITGHGIAGTEMEATVAFGKQFFALSTAQKELILARNNEANLGFIQTGGLEPDAEKLTKADRKERLYSSRALYPGEVIDETSPAGRSQWLPEAALPGFRTAIETAIANKVRLARQLSRAFSLSVGMPETYLEDFHDRLGCIHSFNHYPAVDPAVADRLWGFSPHTDYGTFTILQQDDVGGLQAQNAGGEWIDVPPKAGTFVINVGDLLSRWTNDLYVSTLHRVRNLSPRPRLSISFFAYPNPRATIATLSSCEATRGVYEPVVAGDYIRSLLTQAYTTGQTGISQTTAQRLAR
ncbi:MULTISPECIES: isopenicillin N synthase family oxygenase [unclassified Beijerinckia]|uniref:isopenicillin N synthase family dioxygenase n=1 Tax=unclassified Beijerinckia TaxID=2638183 RepID=UPI00147EB3E3|nr:MULTISPECIES: isopenicillin N synthase family oxygenase [unclassified Beijerinckia]